MFHIETQDPTQGCIFIYAELYSISSISYLILLFIPISLTTSFPHFALGPVTVDTLTLLEQNKE